MDAAQADVLAHVTGWLLTVLGAVYTAYPALRGRLRAPVTRALVVGLAGGTTLSASIALTATPLVGWVALSSIGHAGRGLPSTLTAYGQLVLAAFAAGAVVGLLAGGASAAERSAGAAWRRNIALAVLWLGLTVGGIVASTLRPTLLMPAAVALVGFGFVLGVLVQPPALDHRQRWALALGLPTAFLLLAVVARLTSVAGHTHLAVAVVEAVLIELSATCSVAVPVFVLCRPPVAADREASARRFLASAAGGLLAAAAPAVVNAMLVHGGSPLGYLALGIAPLITALSGDARLLLHTPRARFIRSDRAIRMEWSVVPRRFGRGMLVGAVFALEDAALVTVVSVLVPGNLTVPPAAAVAAAVAGFTLAWGLAFGFLNVVVPLVVARLERIAPERFVVPGIAMVAVGAFLVDHEALVRLIGL